MGGGQQRAVIASLSSTNFGFRILDFGFAAFYLFSLSFNNVPKP
jgi:hypothetical protein